MSGINKIRMADFSVGNITPSTDRVPVTSPSKSNGPSFDRAFENAIEKGNPVNFSTHAQARLATRHIQLSETQLARLQHGVDQAAQKGAKDSLVMLDNLAFIVSVGNRKVVTAIAGAAQSGNVFTQIDSAVIV